MHNKLIAHKFHRRTAKTQTTGIHTLIRTLFPDDTADEIQKTAASALAFFSGALVPSPPPFIFPIEIQQSKESSFDFKRRVVSLFKEGKFKIGEHTIDLERPAHRFIFCLKLRDYLQPDMKHLQKIPGALQRGNIFCDEIQTRVSKNIDEQSSGELMIQTLSMKSIYHVLESLNITAPNTHPDRYQTQGKNAVIDIEVYKPLLQILTTMFTRVEDTAQPFTNIDARPTPFSAEEKTHLARDLRSRLHNTRLHVPKIARSKNIKSTTYGFSQYGITGKKPPFK